MADNRDNTGNDKVGPGNPPKHTRFKKGQTGNPNGRPRKLPELETIIANVLGEENGGKTAAEQILSALQKKAAKGDVRAAKELLDRGYGLPKQKVEHSGGIAHNIVYNQQPGNEPLPE